MLTTTNRVPANTAKDVNECIERETQMRLHYYAAHRDLIPARLEELDKEWDIERTLEANAAAASLVAVALGILVSRKWLFLPAVIGGFLMQHAVQGWCPPLPVFRRLGVRTQTEIERERYALKALRGDFSRISEMDIDEEQSESVAREAIESTRH
jgi:hypothetical protein